MYFYIFVFERNFLIYLCMYVYDEIRNIGYLTKSLTAYELLSRKPFSSLLTTEWYQKHPHPSSLFQKWLGSAFSLFQFFFLLYTRTYDIIYSLLDTSTFQKLYPNTKHICPSHKYLSWVSRDPIWLCSANSYQNNRSVNVVKHVNKLFYEIT